MRTELLEQCKAVAVKQFGTRMHWRTKYRVFAAWDLATAEYRKHLEQMLAKMRHAAALMAAAPMVHCFEARRCAQCPRPGGASARCCGRVSAPTGPPSPLRGEQAWQRYAHEASQQRKKLLVVIIRLLNSKMARTARTPAPCRPPGADPLPAAPPRHAPSRPGSMRWWDRPGGARPCSSEQPGG